MDIHIHECVLLCAAERFIQVDYVMAKVLDGGQCVKNGVIYKIDQVLGAPSRKILDELRENPQLRLLTHFYDEHMLRQCPHIM